jgi:hypothetical protein
MKFTSAISAILLVICAQTVTANLAERENTGTFIAEIATFGGGELVHTTTFNATINGLKHKVTGDKNATSDVDFLHLFFESNGKKVRIFGEIDSAFNGFPI